MLGVMLHLQLPPYPRVISRKVFLLNGLTSYLKAKVFILNRLEAVRPSGKVNYPQLHEPLTSLFILAKWEN